MGFDLISDVSHFKILDGQIGSSHWDACCLTCT